MDQINPLNFTGRAWRLMSVALREDRFVPHYGSLRYSVCGLSSKTRVDHIHIYANYVWGIKNVKPLLLQSAVNLY